MLKKELRFNLIITQIKALKSNVHFRKITGTKSLPNVSKLYLEKNHFDIGNSVKESKKGVQVISHFIIQSVFYNNIHIHNLYQT